MNFLNVHLKWLISTFKANKTPVAIIAGFGMLAFVYLWSLLPSPWNPRYLFNLTFRQPEFICRDGLYSWAGTRSGACSSHGGIARKYVESQ